MERRIATWACVIAAACGRHGAGSDGGGGEGGSDGSAADAAVPIGESVLELHGSPSRVGAYVAPGFSHAAAATMHVDPAFAPPITGEVYAQPLYVDGLGGRDLVLVASEYDEVTAIDPADGSIVWHTTLGAPQPMPNPAEGAPCGRISPLGITGTPAVDLVTRTMFFDAMIRDNNAAHHRIVALSIDDGSIRAGWPIDVGTAFSQFVPAPQGSRGASTFLHGVAYVPYGGLNGDCGSYHGWVVAAPATDPSTATAFMTRDLHAGIWSPGGLSSDGTSMFAVTGNGQGGATWNHSEAVLRLGAGATFSERTADYWAPTNWQQLDALDTDLGGAPALVVDVPGATPSALLAAFGKDGNVYLIDRANMGGIAAPVASLHASTSVIITTPASYRTARGTYLVFKGHGVAGCPGVTTTSNVIAVRVDPTTPPTLTLAWCASAGGGTGAPIATTTDGTSDPIVWVVAADTGDGRLYGFDGDTGDVVFGGGGTTDIIFFTSRFISPIYAKGRLFVATGRSGPGGHLVALRPN